MDKMKNMSIHLFLMAINFYILPAFIWNTKSGVFFLIVLVPLVCLALSVSYGAKEGFNLTYLGLVFVLSIPTSFLYYNKSAYMYFIIYTIVAALRKRFGRKS